MVWVPMQFVPGQLAEVLGLLKTFVSPGKLSRCWQVVMVSEADCQTVIGINAGFYSEPYKLTELFKAPPPPPGLEGGPVWKAAHCGKGSGPSANLNICKEVGGCSRRCGSEVRGGGGVDAAMAAR